MFLLKFVFWLGLVVAFIPVNPADLEEGQRAVTPLETVGLAKSVVVDVASFCQRNPASCETGGQLFSQMGLKAREGAKFAYQFLDRAVGENETAIADDAASDNAQKLVDPVETAATR